MRKTLLALLLLLILTGFFIPQRFSMPVMNAQRNSYHPKSFWYEPWGKSGTHKGVDIFAKEGTTVLASTSGLVLYKGSISMGGNIIVVLGPGWKLHYYAHLQSMDVSMFSWVSRKEKIATVGTTGNAKGKPPHLHYSIVTLFPYVWQIDGATQGWKKMFYIDPVPLLQGTAPLI